MPMCNAFMYVYNVFVFCVCVYVCVYVCVCVCLCLCVDMCLKIFTSVWIKALNKNTAHIIGTQNFYKICYTYIRHTALLIFITAIQYLLSKCLLKLKIANIPL